MDEHGNLQQTLYTPECTSSSLLTPRLNKKRTPTSWNCLDLYISMRAMYVQRPEAKGLGVQDLGLSGLEFRI